MTEKEMIEFTIDKNILKTSGIELAEVKTHLSELADLFKSDYIKMFPSKINDNWTLENLIHLNKNLRVLRECEGFDRHIKGFKDKSLHAPFVTEIARYLSPKVEKLTLDPLIPGKKKRSDILIKHKGQLLYIECKTIQPAPFEYSVDHKKFFTIIKPFINAPHQVDIKYRTSLSKRKIKKLGLTLQNILPKVTGDGTIIHNKNIEVGVIKRETYGNRNLSLEMIMNVEDLSDNCLYPGHVFVSDGVTVTVSGPVVDFSKIIKKKIKDSRKQSAYKKPYILAIDTSMFLGDNKENLRVVQTSFQPKSNTRFSGVLFARPERRIKDFRIKFNFIANPFSKHPLSNDFKYLFQSN